jgi:glucokinase
MAYYVGVDLGASRVRVALFRVEPAGREPRLVARRAAGFPRAGGPGEPAGLVASLILEALREAGLGPAAVEAVGVASIGPLDRREGSVVGAPNAPIPSFPLRRPLEAELGVPVVVENDCNAGAWGEYVLGRGRGLGSLVYVAVGTGVGAGAVVGGRLLVGPRGLAAEAGHVVLDPWSPLECGCGGRGHWEALASGSRLPGAARLLATRWEGPETPALAEARSGRLGYPELARHAGAGDPFALHVAEWLASIHAAGIATLIAAYDPQAVYLGGGALLGAWSLLYPRILEALRRLEPYRLGVPVERATFGGDASLYGALALALRPPETI